MGRKATSRPAKPRNQQAQASLVQMVSTSSAPLPQDDSSLLQANSQTVPQIFTAGIDEAGRGCLAGPVVAAAVILPECYDLPGLNDSKACSAKTREMLAPRIRQCASSLGAGRGVARPH